MKVRYTYLMPRGGHEGEVYTLCPEEDMKVRYTHLMPRGGHEGEVYIPYAQRRT